MVNLLDRRLAYLAVFFAFGLGGSVARDATSQYSEQSDVTLSTSDEKKASVMCNPHLKQLFDDMEEGRVSFDTSLFIHRNGEVEPCGRVASLSIDALDKALSPFRSRCRYMNKYEVESLLTHYLLQTLDVGACGSVDDKKAIPGFAGFCDMGPERTVKNKDYKNLIRVKTDEVSDDSDVAGSLPCRFFTREGSPVGTLDALVKVWRDANSLYAKSRECVATDPESAEECVAAMSATEPPSFHLYAVPAGRVFMFAPSHVGEVFVLDHVQPPPLGNETDDSTDRTVKLTVLSVVPRVFDISNFFSAAEADEILYKALIEPSETHGFHRSTTGTSNKAVFSKRTSENAWDTHGKVAQKIKRRCFTLLGIDVYEESYSDGLQILRYNQTNAYVDHMDYLDINRGDLHDYDSSRKGSNRFATILLYMNDLPESAGGETVFSKAPPLGVSPEDMLSEAKAIELLRESGDAKVLEPGSWEERMTALCRTRLAIQPKATRAVLFYSQHPNGAPDYMSRHGGCPVLHGTKLAANLWTWSGIRPDFPGAPLTREPSEEEKKKNKVNPTQLHATFRNSGEDPTFDKAELYYDEDGFFGKLGPNQQVAVNTFEGHRWNIKVDGKTLKTFVIDHNEVQKYTI